MKTFRRFLMFFTPILVIGLAAVFVPQVRPDLSEYRELRRKEFFEGIDITGTGPAREIRGWFESFAVRGYIGFDFGKIRVAIADFDAESESERMGWSGAGDHHLLDTSQPAPPDAGTAPPGIGAALPFGTLRGVPAPVATRIKAGMTRAGGWNGSGKLATRWTRIPGGTRVEMDGTEIVFAFTDGKVEIDGREFSGVDKPILVVLGDDGHIELTEDLPEKLIPPDTVTP